LPACLYFAIPRVSTRFLVFEQSSKYLRQLTGRQNLTIKQTLLCGFLAGTIEAFAVTTIIETLKVKIIADAYAPASKYKHFWHAVYSILKTEGPKGVYKGVFPTVTKIGLNEAIRFLLFTKIRSFFENKRKQPLEIYTLFLIGSFAGGVSVFVTHPFDVVKTRIQNNSSKEKIKASYVIKDVWGRAGWIGFYKGVFPRLMRVSIEVGLQMTLYSKITALLITLW